MFTFVFALFTGDFVIQRDDSHIPTPLPAASPLAASHAGVSGGGPSKLLLHSDEATVDMGELVPSAGTGSTVQAPPSTPDARPDANQYGLTPLLFNILVYSFQDDSHNHIVVDPAPFQVPALTAMSMLHYLFAVCMYSRIYVVQQGRLVGIVYKGDFLKDKWLDERYRDPTDEH